MANEENLVPFKPGYDPRREGNGRPKGRKSLATIIRELEDEEFDWTIIPKHGKKFQEQFGHLGSPFKVIVLVATLQAIRGDEKAREWLRSAGYGNKLDLTSGDKPIVAPLVVSVIGDRNVAPQAEATDGSGSGQ